MFTTFAVAFILIVTGPAPHEKRMIPPARTAASTAAEVQLAGVPCPTTRLGCDVSTARPPAGTGTGDTAGADALGEIDAAAGTLVAPSIRPHAHAIASDARPGIRQG
ncbi:MAG TPA: hypothetical protein VGL69_17990 [Solirubrobacteraceae bacterium]